MDKESTLASLHHTGWYINRLLVCFCLLSAHIPAPLPLLRSLPVFINSSWG